MNSSRLFVPLALFLTIGAARASSLMNVGPLADLDDIWVDDVLIGFELTDDYGRAVPLFTGDRQGEAAFRAHLREQVILRLKRAGLRVDPKSDNVIGFGFFGGKFSGACPNQNFYLLVVHVGHAGESSDVERTRLGVVDDEGLASELEKTALYSLDEFLEQRKSARMRAAEPAKEDRTP